MRRHLQSLFKAVGSAWSMLGITLLMLLVVEKGLRLMLDVRDRRGEQEVIRVRAAANNQEEWTRDYDREFNASLASTWRPYLYFRRLPFAGRFIHVDESGRRHTWNAPAGNKPAPEGAPKPYRIFLFGGSTMWGTGARDDYTIPSLLSRRLAEGSRPVEVENFGESGYVSTQELISFVLELRRGNVPDLAIFYDGVNDVYSALQGQQAGIPENEDNRVREFNAGFGAMLGGLLRSSAAFRVASRFAPKASPTGGDRLGREAVDVYAANLKIIEALATQYGFRARFYWQPSVYSKQRLADHERRMAQADAWLESGYIAARKALPELASHHPGFRDLSDVLGDDNRLFFTDFCHISEAGNAKVADAMGKDVQSLMTSGSAQ